MKTFKKISMVSIFWFGVWAIFILIFQRNGVDYVHNPFVTCIFFSVVISTLYRFFIVPNKSKGDHFSIKELGIASASVIVASVAYYLLNRFVIPASYDGMRETLEYSLRVNPTFLITKAFEIMFQQAFFIISIHYLFKNGLSAGKDTLLFGLYALAIHLPLFFFVPFYFACVIVLSSFFAGVIFSHFIVQYKNGFMWSYVVHYWFYIGIAALFWFAKLHII